MANKVFANGREVACKAGAGKTICAFPDVCFTPPQTPATPPGVPIPYPNSAFAKDTADGSKTVKISRKEVMLKDKSYFKRSTGDEAGCAAKKGVVTSKITGKVYFKMWSMDVKFEDENVVRHLDTTTNNHNTDPGNEGLPWPFVDSQAMAPGGDCDEEVAEEKRKCAGKTRSQACRNKECQAARKCMLVPYGGKGSPNCCPPQVAHHILPNSLLQGVRGVTSTNVSGLHKSGRNAYTLEGAPCVCCDGKKGVSNPIGTHKEMHDRTKVKLKKILVAGRELTYSDAKAKVAEAHNETFRKSDGSPQCRKKCIEHQIDTHMKRTGTGSKIKVLQKDGATTTNYAKYKAGEVD
ncbi:MAG: DUF4150 domain-containing protein [Sedimentisphaerales bacterium]|nr:DUF4150 domain-containing protein [Sedimentisphaerales bacterium]